jgi:hypothetical protein
MHYNFTAGGWSNTLPKLTSLTLSGSHNHIISPTKEEKYPPIIDSASHGWSNIQSLTLHTTNDRGSWSVPEKWIGMTKKLRKDWLPPDGWDEATECYLHGDERFILPTKTIEELDVAELATSIGIQFPSLTMHIQFVIILSLVFMLQLPFSLSSPKVLYNSDCYVNCFTIIPVSCLYSRPLNSHKCTW